MQPVVKPVVQPVVKPVVKQGLTTDFTPQPHHNRTTITPQLHHTGNRSDRRDEMKILARVCLARLWRTRSLRQTFIHWRIYAVPCMTLKPCILMWSISVFSSTAKCDEMGDTPSSSDSHSTTGQPMAGWKSGWTRYHR